MDNKRLDLDALAFKPSIALQNNFDELKTSTNSLNILESELDGSLGNEVSMSYRAEQQRKGSIPHNQIKVGEEVKVIVVFEMKFSSQHGKVIETNIFD